MINSNVKLSGDPSTEALASGLATLGRYGDSYMVHAAEGETVIPGEILDANPALKSALFSQMKAMGVEDPNRYVVGSALNSINPITGQPEFFFKKIWRAIKKIGKKILPIAAPIIGNIIAPGIGGLLASGLVTKLQGGSWTDALKSAGMSYLGGVATSGIMGGLSSPGNFVGGFTSGLQSGAMQPFNAAKGLFASGADNTFSQGIFGGLGSNDGIMSGQYFKNIQNADGIMDTTGKILAPQYNPNAGVEMANNMRDAEGAIPQTQTDADTETVSNFQGQTNEVFNNNAALGSKPRITNTRVLTPQEIAQQQYEAMAHNMEFGTAPDQSLVNTVDPFPGTLNDAIAEAGAGPMATAESQQIARAEDDIYNLRDKSFFEKMKDKATSPEFLGKAAAGAVPGLIAMALTPGQDDLSEEEMKALTSPQRAAYDQYTLQKASNPDFAQTPEGQALLAKAGITATRTASQLARSTGTTLEQAEDFQRRRYGMVKQAPSQQLLSGITSLASASQMPENELAAPIGMTMAANGGEIIGPGTGRSDSIPARLSDGEFVMTAQAVRNAGNGNRELGAARMYDMMNKFERAV